MLGNSACFLLSSDFFFSKINVFKKVLGSTKGVPWHQTFMDPVQDEFSVGPDLGLNCLQVISADIKSYLLYSMKRVKEPL